MIDSALAYNLKSIAASSRKERCGAICDGGHIVEIDNVSKNYHSFVFNRKQWVDLIKSGRTITALWHTHPSGNTEPSEADLNFIRHSKMDMIIVTSATWRYITCQEI